MINNTLELTSLRSVIGIGLAELDKSAHILDFGGGGGSHFYIARTAYPHYRFKWCVVETERMAKRANELVNEEDLYFVSSLENEKVKNESFDLVFCSGSLQYTSDPLGNLQKLVDLQIKYLFITRTVLSESEEVSIFQQISMLSANGPGPLPTGYRDRRVAYSLTSVPRSQFESIIHSKYKIVLSILEDEITFDVSKGTQKMYGYFCVLKT
jgi:putative methyltransferase (TIGR04325 family)